MAAVYRDAPLEFLRTAYSPDDWVAVFLKSYESGQVAQRVEPVARILDPRFQGWLRWRNLMQWNVYVSVNAVAAGSRSRTRDAVTQVRHVFVDADHDGPQVLSNIAGRRDIPPASDRLTASPGVCHGLWRDTAC